MTKGHTPHALMSSFSSDIIYLDPNSIKVTNRQRREINLDDILDSILRNGVINPIVIKKEAMYSVEGVKIIRSQCEAQQSYCEFPKCNGCGFNIPPTLVAGERRLEACKKLNLQVPCRFLSSLSPLEAQVIEFEENHKRKNLPWREEVTAIGTIHKSYLIQNPNHTPDETALILSIPLQKFNQILHVFNFIDEKILTHAETLTQAINLLQRFKSQKSEELRQNLKSILNTKPIPDYLKPIPKKLETTVINFDYDFPPISPPLGGGGLTVEQKPTEPPSIINVSFLDWIKTYEGPKFNFIHCDFPQSPENFNLIFNSFMGNINSILDYPCHILFWLKMDFYEKVKYWFENDGEFEILAEPLIWYKSDTKQNQIFGEAPKSTYEAALIINHGSRPFKKQIQNAYATPRASQPICPNQKSVTMLKYFFSTFIDLETNFFDPSCGSASSLVAAEELNAKSVLGLELVKNRFDKASERLFKSREIRKHLREK